MPTVYTTIYLIFSVLVKSDGFGKEIISFYKTDIDHGQVFWGDLNARQMLWRKYANFLPKYSIFYLDTLRVNKYKFYMYYANMFLTSIILI